MEKGDIDAVQFGTGDGVGLFYIFLAAYFSSTMALLDTWDFQTFLLVLLKHSVLCTSVVQ